MRLKRVLPLVAAAVLAVPAAGSASHLSVTANVAGSGDIVAGVQVQLPIEVTCDPFVPSPFGSFASVQVQLQQRVGRSVTEGNGFLTPICDGTTHSYTVSIRQSAPALAFHGGRAIATISAMVCELDPLTFQQHCTAFNSTEEVRLRG